MDDQLLGNGRNQGLSVKVWEGLRTKLRQPRMSAFRKAESYHHA
jgi:hypothetical protein